MKKLFAKLLVFAVVLTASAPSGAAIGQRRGKGVRPNRVTVVRRLNQATLSPAAIKTISSLRLFRGVVAVRAKAIRPLAGSSLWQLSNGGYIVVGGSTVEPLASEVYTRDFGNGDLMVWACYCPGYDANKDDGCKFDGPANALSCTQSGGVNCNCKFEDFMITNDGSVIGFEGATG